MGFENKGLRMLIGYATLYPHVGVRGGGEAAVPPPSMADQSKTSSGFAVVVRSGTS